MNRFETSINKESGNVESDMEVMEKIACEQALLFGFHARVPCERRSRELRARKVEPARKLHSIAAYYQNTERP